ncbi:hypothetical protein V5E43_000697 [Yersinia enterocolitica]|uniref:hypothetical protein n=1 Tax=Yersinia TaxID=629 RepID=UPI0005DAB168|nr:MULTISPECIES: hypothetical protein [Yersinia]MCW6576424.1 hypothetical protein [Yersinia ruckeri]CND59553.1 Uncharacterised protein [Yersinia pseudotuberculosis]CQH79079.1 Uncharacterised protein [Yersinia enterocolitica]HDL6887663.1 hypothetical protein [Yersinia enterocolitica]HDL6901017.1 hypothetical protein [Yersinia enterocolitica]
MDIKLSYDALERKCLSLEKQLNEEKSLTQENEKLFIEEIKQDIWIQAADIVRIHIRDLRESRPTFTDVCKILQKLESKVTPVQTGGQYEN